MHNGKCATTMRFTPFLFPRQENAGTLTLSKNRREVTTQQLVASMCFGFPTRLSHVVWARARTKSYFGTTILPLPGLSAKASYVELVSRYLLLFTTTDDGAFRLRFYASKPLQHHRPYPPMNKPKAPLHKARREGCTVQFIHSHEEHLGKQRSQSSRCCTSTLTSREGTHQTQNIEYLHYHRGVPKGRPTLSLIKKATSMENTGFPAYPTIDHAIRRDGVATESWFPRHVCLESMYYQMAAD